MQRDDWSIVAFGDSVTLVEDPTQNIGTGYVPSLKEIVKEKGASVTISGKGYPFETTDSLKEMFKKDVIQNKPRPHAVVICAGGNDLSTKAWEIYRHYRRFVSKNKDLLPVEYLQGLDEDPFKDPIEIAYENLCCMYEKARQNKIFPIAVSVPPVLSRLPAHFVNTPISSLNSKIEEYCKGKKIPFVDIHSELFDPEKELKRAEYSLDPNHYNTEGNALIADLIYEEGIKNIPGIPVKELSLVN